MSIVFQSTRPAGGATRVCVVAVVALEVSIHAPRGGRDCSRTSAATAPECFNPRAPRGARQLSVGAYLSDKTFQSTRPAGGATHCQLREWRKPSCFNPRAPRGARLHIRNTIVLANCFNPRAPRGARPSVLFRRLGSELFQSTRPAGGATWGAEPALSFDDVSIHAPRGGRDALSGLSVSYSLMFQSTRPAGGATSRYRKSYLVSAFQSTRPAGGATCGLICYCCGDIVSIHAPRGGRDRGMR